MSACVLVSVEELAFAVVRQIAPDEVASFTLMARPCFDDPSGATHRLRTRHDDPLGIGLDGIVAMITPIVSLVCVALATEIAKDVAISAKSHAARTIRKLIRLRSKKNRQTESIPVDQIWAVDDLEKVHKIAAEEARQLGLTDDGARQLADSIVGQLLARKP